MSIPCTRHKILSHIIIVIILGMATQLNGQYSWNWKDPVDWNFIDFGDNKLIGYNLLGVGLVYLFDKSKAPDQYTTRRVTVGIMREYRRTPLSTIWSASTEYGTSLKKYLAIGGGIRLYGVSGEGVNTAGIGGFVWFDWYIINKESWKIGYTNGVGPNYFLDPFPAGGTRFNFTTHYGITIQKRINDRWLSLDLLNWHLSNADIKGRERNPALDAIGLQVGYSF